MRRLGLFCLVSLAFACSGCRPESKALRVGYFPNLTHAQALVALQNQAFEKALPGVPVEWKAFNAGPALIEAIFAGEIDLGYSGPNPAINGYLKSSGAALQVLAGAAEGGAALVVRGDWQPKDPAEFKGKRLATPQTGNTQDIAARLWVLQHGLGRQVGVLPIANADQLLLFQKHSLDAAWTVEPWVSRLQQEAGARIYLDEKKLWPGGHYVTTCLVGRTEFLKRHAGWARAVVAAHARVTDWMNAHPAEAMDLCAAQLAKDTGKALPPAIIREAWQRLSFTSRISLDLLEAAATHASQVGYLELKGNNLEGIYNPDFSPGAR